MANFFKGLLRANTTIYGDLEGAVTKLKNGRLAIAIEKDKSKEEKCIAWIVGQKDIELSKGNVKKVEFVDHAVVNDISSNAGKSADVSIYRIEMTDGTTGTLRLKTSSEEQVLRLIR